MGGLAEAAKEAKATKATARAKAAARAALALSLVAGALGALTGGCAGEAMSLKKPIVLRANLTTHQLTLPNGLEVVLHPDVTFRDVVVDLRFDVGGRDDPPGRSGLAHLVEHLTFLRRVDREGDVSALLARAGSASHNAFTSRDETEYYEAVPATELPTALWLEAGRIALPLDGVTDEDFERERRVVANEREQRVGNVPHGSMDDACTAELFPSWHPYRRPVIGLPDELAATTLSDARAFVDRHYAPNNATLVVAGRFDVARASELVSRYFAQIPPGRPPPPKHVALPDTSTGTSRDRTRRLVVDANVANPAGEVCWLAPPAATRGWHELGLLRWRLGAQTRYRMGASLRRLDVDLDDGSVASVFRVRFEVDADTRPQRVIDLLDEELERLSDAYDHLGDDKSAALAYATLGLAELTKRATTLQDLVSRYGDANSLQRELHALSTVSSLSQRGAVDAFLRKAGRVFVEVRPDASAPKSGRIRR